MYSFVATCCMMNMTNKKKLVLVLNIISGVGPLLHLCCSSHVPLLYVFGPPVVLLQLYFFLLQEIENWRSMEAQSTLEYLGQWAGLSSQLVNY